MELLFVTILGAGIGALIRYNVKGRETHGMLLLPSLAGAVTAAVWLVAVWAGLTFDGTWIWVASLVAGGVAALVAALVLPKRRREADEQLFAKLTSAKA